MPYSDKDRCLALAGVFQAATLVTQVARHNPVHHDSLNANIGSLFFMDADNVEQIYGGKAELRLGLESLRDTLVDLTAGKKLATTRYVISLLHLAKRLNKHPRIGAALGEGLAESSTLAESLGASHDTVIAKLAELYRDTISLMGPRIIVHGEPDILADENKASLIRALLLSGVRAGVLWYQCGGNRLQLLFSRNTLLSEAQDTLARI